MRLTPLTSKETITEAAIFAAAFRFCSLAKKEKENPTSLIVLMMAPNHRVTRNRNAEPPIDQAAKDPVFGSNTVLPVPSKSPSYLLLGN